MKKKIILILFISLIFLCGWKEDKPFMKQVEFELSKETDTFESPAFFYTTNENSEHTYLEDVEFVPNKLSYSFKDFNLSEKDENGNMILSFKCEVNGAIEYYAPVSIGKIWSSLTYDTPLLFDYYTGDIYKQNVVSLDNSVVLFEYDNEIDSNSYSYTDIEWDDITKKIGVRVDNKFSVTGQEKLGTENGKRHVKNNIYLELLYYVEIPENYDGVMLALGKDGITEEKGKKMYDNSLKLKSLKDEAEKTGEKSEELILLEKEQKSIKKIIDLEANSNKMDNYYVIDLAIIFNLEHKEIINNSINLLLIILIPSILIIVIILFLIIHKKKKKVKNNITIDNKQSNKKGE